MQKSFKKLRLGWKIIPGYCFEPFYENVHHVHERKDTNNFFPSVMKELCHQLQMFLIMLILYFKQIFC